MTGAQQTWFVRKLLECQGLACRARSPGILERCWKILEQMWRVGIETPPCFKIPAKPQHQGSGRGSAAVT